MTHLRAILWCAVSTAAQSTNEKESLPSQEAEARALAQREGWTITDVLVVPGHSRRYIDIGECAADMRRAGVNAFDRLLEHWERCDFDILLVRDASRFARTQTLHAYVVERTISVGARIYSLSDGWVDDNNYRMWIAMGGYSAAGEVDRLIKGRERARDRQAREGKPVSTSVVMSHRRVRDSETGKVAGFDVAAEHTQLWHDVCTLLLEGHGWRQIERELQDRFGHTRPNGKRYGQGRMYQILTNPVFWGHNPRRHRRRGRFATAGPWMLEPGHTVPDDVIIYYNTHEPALTGERAEILKAEIIRRMGMIGTARPYGSIWTGLFVCGECGYRTVKYVHGVKCASHWNQSETRPDCSQRKTLPGPYIRTYISELLQRMVDRADPDMLVRTDSTDVVKQQSEQVLKSMVDLQDQARTLIMKQAEAGAALASLYDEQLARINDRLDALQRQHEALDQQLRADLRGRRGRDQIVDRLQSDGVDAFWSQEDHQINQALHRLLGNRCFVALDGEITGIADPPAHWNTKKKSKNRQT